MEGFDINQLILGKLESDVREDDVREFIIEVLKIEQESVSNRGRIKEYERALAKYVKTE